MTIEDHIPGYILTRIQLVTIKDHISKYIVVRNRFGKSYIDPYHSSHLVYVKIVLGNTTSSFILNVCQGSKKRWWGNSHSTYLKNKGMSRSLASEISKSKLGVHLRTCPSITITNIRKHTPYLFCNYLT